MSVKVCIEMMLKGQPIFAIMHVIIEMSDIRNMKNPHSNKYTSWGLLDRAAPRGAGSSTKYWLPATNYTLGELHVSENQDKIPSAPKMGSAWPDQRTVLVRLHGARWAPGGHPSA